MGLPEISSGGNRLYFFWEPFTTFDLPPPSGADLYTKVSWGGGLLILLHPEDRPLAKILNILLVVACPLLSEDKFWKTPYCITMTMTSSYCMLQDPVEEEWSSWLWSHHILHILQQCSLPDPCHCGFILCPEILQPYFVSFCWKTLQVHAGCDSI